MSLGQANHLWIHGAVPPELLRDWLNEALPSAYRGTFLPKIAVVSCFRVGEAVTLVSLAEADWKMVKGDVAERVPLFESVSALAVSAGFDCTHVEVSDTGGLRWQVETLGKTRRGARMDPAGEADYLPEGPTPEADEEAADIFGTLSVDGTWKLDPSAPDLARSLICKCVNLPLAEIHHYIEWADALEDAVDARRPVEGLLAANIERLFPNLFLVWRWQRLPEVRAATELGRGRSIAQASGEIVRPVQSVFSFLLWLGVEFVRWWYVVLIAIVGPAFLYPMIFKIHPTTSETFWTVFLMTCAVLAVSAIAGDRERLRTRASVLVGYELAIAMTCYVYYSGKS